MFGFCDMGMVLKGWMFVIVDRWIVRQIVRGCVKSLSENGILCVHMIGYKPGYGTSKNIKKDNYKMGIYNTSWNMVQAVDKIWIYKV